MPKYVENKVVINEIPINYVKVGKGKHNILLSPGSLGTWETDFKVTLDSFDNENFTIVAWDPPGQGKSRPPERKYVPEISEIDGKMANELMKTLGLLPYSALGFSEGGRTAIHAAFFDAENVKKLVFWGTPVEIDKAYTDAFYSTRDLSGWPADKLNTFIKIYGKSTLQEVWNEYTEMCLKCYQLNGGNICRDILPQIRQPTFVLYGDEDWLGGGIEQAMKNSKRIPNARLALRQQGRHDIHNQFPQWFNAAVERFLLQ